MDQGLIRVRDFAQKCGCTPQNIYGHLKTYAAELEGHMIQGKGRQGVFLDEEAQEFLRSIMYPKEISKDTAVVKLQNEVAELRTALFQAMQKGMEMSAMLSATEAERDRLRLDVAGAEKRLRLAEESQVAKDVELSRVEQEAAEARQKAQELEDLLGKVQAERDAAEARERALKARNLIERVFRKGE